METVITLGMLILIQVVLGFDNLLYISLEAKNAPAERRIFVRNIGIWLAIVLRIGLLLLLMTLVKYIQEPIVSFEWKSYIVGKFNLYSLIELLGGVFIIYTATKEIWHMLSLEESVSNDKKKEKSVTGILVMIIIMNIVFSIDSTLSAMALSNIFWLMAASIVISGILMLWMADRVTLFLQKNRAYEVLGLFILFLVGVMLISEGGHIAHLKVFDYEITSMSKATFYFVLIVLIIVDIVQSKYKKNLMKLKELKSDIS